MTILSLLILLLVTTSHHRSLSTWLTPIRWSSLVVLVWLLLWGTSWLHRKIILRTIVWSAVICTLDINDFFQNFVPHVHVLLQILIHNDLFRILRSLLIWKSEENETETAASLSLSVPFDGAIFDHAKLGEILFQMNLASAESQAANEKFDLIFGRGSIEDTSSRGRLLSLMVWLVTSTAIVLLTVLMTITLIVIISPLVLTIVARTIVVAWRIDVSSLSFKRRLMMLTIRTCLHSTTGVTSLMVGLNLLGSLVVVSVLIRGVLGWLLSMCCNCCGVISLPLVNVCRLDLRSVLGLTLLASSCSCIIDTCTAVLVHWNYRGCLLRLFWNTLLTLQVLLELHNQSTWRILINLRINLCRKN